MIDKNLEAKLLYEVDYYVKYIQEMFQENQNLERGHFDLEGVRNTESIENEIEKAGKLVKTEIDNKDLVRKRICAALSKVSGDVFEVAKDLAPVIIALSVAKTINIPSEGLILAYAVIAVARMGTAALCVDYTE